MALLMKITVMILAAQRRVHDLGHADGGQVAVALVGEDNLIGLDALDAGGHGRGAAMRRLDEIDLKVVVGKHRAAHRRDADGVLADAQLVDHLGDQAMRHAVRAAGAVMRVHIAQRVGPLVDELFDQVWWSCSNTLP